MARKRSNLAVAADVGTVQEVLRIAEAAGPHIAVLKTHVDIFNEWNGSIAAQLRKLAEEHGEMPHVGTVPLSLFLLMPGMEADGRQRPSTGLHGQPGKWRVRPAGLSCDGSKARQTTAPLSIQYCMCPSDARCGHEAAEGVVRCADFMIFEDRKFADIGNTVVAQYGGGIYRIADWSDMTNAHLVPGTGIIDGLKTVRHAYSCLAGCLRHGSVHLTIHAPSIRMGVS